MKDFTCLLILFFLVQIAQAQMVGIKGGLNLSNVEGLSTSTNSATGFQAGPIAEYSLANILYLNTGLLYSEKGYHRTNGVILSEKWNYLELPLNLAFKFKAFKFLKVFVQTGPYGGYLIGVKKEYNPLADVMPGYKMKRKKTDYGVGFGTGVELGPFVAGLNYQLGMMNLNDGSTETTNYKNKVLQISLACMFGKH